MTANVGISNVELGRIYLRSGDLKTALTLFEATLDLALKDQDRSTYLKVIPQILRVHAEGLDFLKLHQVISEFDRVCEAW